MNNRQKLKQCRESLLEIQRIRNQISEWKKLAFSLRSPSDLSQEAVRSSRKANAPYEDLLIKCDDYERELYKKIDKLILKQKEAEKIIDVLDNQLGRTVLKYYYVNGYDFDLIANELSYSKSHIYYLHRTMIKKI